MLFSGGLGGEWRCIRLMRVTSVCFKLRFRVYRLGQYMNSTYFPKTVPELRLGGMWNTLRIGPVTMKKE